MSHDVETVSKSPEKLESTKRAAADHMRNQVTAFAIMILFTFLAFGLAQAKYSPSFVIPIILLFAVIQVLLQLYFFMHWNEKGHGAAQIFMYSGLLVAFTMVLCFVTIVWW